MASLILNLPINAPTLSTPLHDSLTTTGFSFKISKPARPARVTCAVAKPVAGQEEPATKIRSGTSERWREIHGQNNWSGMLDPMDPLLRTEILRYGEMTQACYGAFDNDPYSKYCGSCKFPPKSFFKEQEIDDLGYDVTSYIYSSNTSELIPRFFSMSLMSDGPWNPMVNWIGYIAVSNDETTARLGRRDIAIAWRGTVTKVEWVEDLISFLKPVSAENLSSPDPDIKVMAGFLHVYTDKDQKCPYSKFSAREQVLAEVRRLMKIYGDKGEELSITITGHSLGSAVATLCAYDIAESKLNVLNNKQTVPVSVFSFSGPRLGNTKFKKRLNTLGVKVLRTLNIHDKVPTVPGVILNVDTIALFEFIGEWVSWFYSHVGVELALDHKKSPFVKEYLDLVGVHNMELLLHLVDGYQGEGAPFSLATGRDKALVNKEGDILKEEQLIPPFWLQVENKRLVRNANGYWQLPEQGGIEDHLRPEDVEYHLKELGLTALL